MRTFFAIMFLFSLSLPKTVFSQPKKEGFELRAGTLFGGNPFALAITTDAEYTWKLYKTDNPILSNHLSFGLKNSFAGPIGDFLCICAEFSPLALLDIRLGGGPFVNTGFIGAGVGFVDYDDDFTEPTRNARADAGEGTVILGTNAFVEPTVKLKAGPILASFTSRFEVLQIQNVNDLQGGTFTYFPPQNTLIDGEGDFLITTSAVLGTLKTFAGRNNIFGGLQHTSLTLPGGDNENQRQTVGVLGRLVLGNNSWKPTILAQAYFYAKEAATSGLDQTFGFRGGFVLTPPVGTNKKVKTSPDTASILPSSNTDLNTLRVNTRLNTHLLGKVNSYQ